MMYIWTEAKALAQTCVACSALCGSRINVVFGEGNENADIMFIGEAPGETEDKTGRPFVGRSGQILTNLIQSIGLKREDVYITNLIKCRPPGNRNPDKFEIHNCSPFLISQICNVNPKVICTLGAFAFQGLTGIDTKISKARGKTYSYLDKIVLPTFHPAYILRNPSHLSKMKQDFDSLKTLIGSNLGEQKIPKEFHKKGTK